jgi:cytoskeleton protein RodZ
MTDLTATSGALLKAERERRGLSSQKAADELHLDGWVVDALEAEDYERIGPSVYVKGHLKRYAALLGLPSTELMASYESRAQAANTPAAQPANTRMRTNLADVSNIPLPQIAGSVAAVLLVLGVLWWKPWHQRGAPPPTKELPTATPSAAYADSAPPAAAALTPGASMTTVPAVLMSPPAAALGTAATVGTVAPVGAVGGLGGGAAAPVGPAGPVGATAPVGTPGGLGGGAAAPGPLPASAGPVPAVLAAAAEPNAAAAMGRARLRLTFSADSWVDVHDAAGRRVFAGNVRAKSVRSIAGIAPMRVYLKSASAVQLQINNRAVVIAPQFIAGDAARFEAGADGVLRRDSRSAATPAAPSRSARPNG